MPNYVCRFVPEPLVEELIVTYHAVRTWDAYETPSRHECLIKASKAFHAAHPEHKEILVYKDLCGLMTPGHVI